MAVRPNPIELPRTDLAVRHATPTNRSRTTYETFARPTPTTQPIGCIRKLFMLTWPVGYALPAKLQLSRMPQNLLNAPLQSR